YERIYYILEISIIIATNKATVAIQ
ncbi:MAG: hypothetical protein ACI90V_002697, partial [Bacillariaceae sp.]